MNKSIKAAFALAVIAALPAAAQTVYRCGNSYSPQPCPGGNAVEATTHAPSAQEQATARDQTKREAKAADSMEKARLKEEAKPAQVYVAPAKAQAASAERKPVLTKPKKPAYFTAVAPAAKPDRKKAEK